MPGRGGEDNWFLCPLERKEEAVAYFEACYAGTVEETFIRLPLPVFLKAVGSFGLISFYDAQTG